MPVLTTDIGAAPVGATTATLRGHLTAGVSATNYVYWGTNDWGMTPTIWSNTNSLGLRNTGTFYTAVTGLTPGMPYYYRCYGTNADGEGWSEVVPLTTRVGVASFAGGSYDGYNLRSASAGFGVLCVNNASGATNVTTTSAWLNGILVATSNGEPAEVRVYWGLTEGGTNWENWAKTNSFRSSIAEGQTLTTNVDVMPNTTYYYRFYATNEGGEGWASSSASFFTPSAPELNTGLGAIPVGATTATLRGNLTAGVSALLYVYWGQNTNAWSGTNNLGTRSQGAFDTPVSGLSPGTPYYYRCYGTNGYGAGWAGVVAFTTRVGVASFIGGSYDGYDRRDEQTRMVLGFSGIIFVFY